MHYPKISIVTPSFNQAEFLEQTITSVLSQNYPNLEYIIIDGGSTDGSVEIIKKYADKLTYWVSEPDRGRGEAINKGFQRSTGEIMAWLGCGDMYHPWALRVVREIFRNFSEIRWLTSGSYTTWNFKGQPFRCDFRLGYTKDGFVKGRYLPGIGTLQQESTFWLRSLWDEAGGYVDEKLAMLPDFELWARFFKFAEVYTTHVPLGGICRHNSQDVFLPEVISVGKKIWLKYYRKSAGKFYQKICGIPVLFSSFLALLKIYRIKIVEYDFENEQWRIRKITAWPFTDMV